MTFWAKAESPLTRARTLSLTIYGDLDTTALRQLPAGRRPIETRLVEGAPYDARFFRLEHEIGDGGECGGLSLRDRDRDADLLEGAIDHA